MSDRHVHHHGAVAGLGAGTAAVLVCAVLTLSVWHRVSGEVASALGVIVWGLVAVFLAAAVFAVAYLFLRLRHHLAHPETLTRHSVRAEVIQAPAAETPAIPPAERAALPPAGPHYHFETPEAAEAALRAMTDTEGNRP